MYFSCFCLNEVELQSNFFDSALWLCALFAVWRGGINLTRTRTETSAGSQIALADWQLFPNLQRCFPREIIALTHALHGRVPLRTTSCFLLAPWPMQVQVTWIWILVRPTRPTVTVNALSTLRPYIDFFVHNALTILCRNYTQKTVSFNQRKKFVPVLTKSSSCSGNDTNFFRSKISFWVKDISFRQDK